MKYSVGKICQVYGYSRQCYYKRLRNRQEKKREKEKIVNEVKIIRKRQPRVGTRKLQKMLGKEAIFIGRDRLFGVLKDKEMLIFPRRRRTKTTQSQHKFRTYKNLIKDIAVVKPKEVLVSDITYIDTMEGFKYLSLITDKGSRKILGFSLSHSLSIEGNIEALRMALREIRGVDRIIHHSDRGIQYCSKGHIDLLEKNKIQISMTEKDHVYENALAERVNGILKNELMLGDRLASYKVAKQMVTEAVKIYNQERLHIALGYKTPEQMYVS